jgi:two-component system sensor histidine kinase and response regulator WspE
MSTIDMPIDANIFSIYISDAQIRTKTLASLFNTSSLETLDNDQLQEAIKATQSITSGANLCQLPNIPELMTALANTLLLRIQNKLTPDVEILNSIHRAIDSLDSLNTTSAENISQWHSDNNDPIKQNIAYLTSLATTSPEQPSLAPQDQDNKIQATKKSTTTFKIDPSMFDLFRAEASTQVRTMNDNLLNLENDPRNNTILEPLMRASHSIKGAARMVGLNDIVDLAHRMEDCFVNSQSGTISLDKYAIDLLLFCNDLLDSMSAIHHDQLPQWLENNNIAFKQSLKLLEQLANDGKYNSNDFASITSPGSSEPTHETVLHTTDNKTEHPTNSNDAAKRQVRIPSERLNKMLAVSNELVISQQWIGGHMSSLQILKKRQSELASCVMKLRQKLEDIDISDEIFSELIDTENKVEVCRQTLHEDINHLEDYDRKSYVLSSRLNQEVISSRMRPFSECTHGFKRMVRDISHSLGKDVHLDIEGLDTLVDSDILDMIEAPLTHLLRNAIDHGIEPTDVRLQNGKKAQGLITISAIHQAGKLNITITDDGKGIDTEQLKEKIIEKGLVNRHMADQLSDSELLDFLFLPGFSTRKDVTEYSGRGVGLDVVHEVTTSMRGQIKNSSRLGHGLSVQLQLPLTLSVLHSLLIDIGDEYYAIPLAKIHAVIKKNTTDIFTIENNQLVKFHDKDISLLNGRDLLDCNTSVNNSNVLDIVILNERGDDYAIVVDKIIGEASLALHPIDSRLGKIKDISAAAIADDGKPVLVIDTDDLLINIQQLSGSGQLGSVSRCYMDHANKNLKKILVIDDSLTVREVEKNLLESKGYSVDLAIDGVDGWNTLKSGTYDLVITDIDMPRMNGIELVEKIKDDTHLKNIPVMIVSYKDNPDDRLKGLEAGADYYLTKGSFHDESLIEGVIDLIGETGK